MLYHQAIASTQVRFCWASGVERIVTIEVGAPFRSPKSDWRCELDLRGIEGEVTAMIGVDSLSALGAAMYLLRIRIEAYRAVGVAVKDLDSEEDFILDDLFPPGLKRVPDKSA